MYLSIVHTATPLLLYSCTYGICILYYAYEYYAYAYYAYLLYYVLHDSYIIHTTYYFYYYLRSMHTNSYH